MTLNRIWIPSPNYSTRGGANVRLVVMHTAEGALTYQSLGSFFANPNSQVSSHVGIDDTPNVVGEYVARGNKAWTVANANPVAVSAELCAFTAWSSAEWAAHPTMLANAAQWIKEECEAFNIPMVRLTPAEAQSNGRGICEHVDLGAWGGSHVDCGPNFPLDEVIAMAIGTPKPPPPPPPVGPITEEINVSDRLIQYETIDPAPAAPKVHIMATYGDPPNEVTHHWFQNLGGNPAGQPSWIHEELPT